MTTGIYGRQWNNTTPEFAFNTHLLAADLACMNGKPQHALSLYKKAATTNPIARRRLKIACKQNKMLLNTRVNQNKNNIVKIAFIDWYQGYENDIQPFIINLFEQGGISIQLSEIEKSDILVAGGYKQQLIENPILSEDKLVIFVSGENISPAYNYHDCSLTTRISSFGGKNIRLPQWYGEINFKNDDIRFNEAFNSLPRNSTKRDLLFSAIYNNSTPEREAMIATLRQIFGYNSIHIFGSQRGKSVDKMKVLSRTVVNICFENSIGDGYTTEKLFHSKMMECKSLYWGDTTYRIDFDDKDVHNVKESLELKQTIEWCKKVIKNPSTYHYKGNTVPTNILTRKPELKTLSNFLYSWSQIVLCWRNFN